jgi:hypothetical protein
MEPDLRGEYRALVISRPELFENPRGAGFEILLGEDEIRQAEEHVAEQKWRPTASRKQTKQLRTSCQHRQLNLSRRSLTARSAMASCSRHMPGPRREICS